MYLIKDLLSIIKVKDYRLPAPDMGITEYIYDSRRYVQSATALFIAISSEKNDGHLYIKDLYQLGLRNFIISEPIQWHEDCPEANFIQVDNSLQALQQ